MNDDFLTAEQIRAYEPDPCPTAGVDPRERARSAMQGCGHWHDGQQYGRRWPIGCVALEITQRCNLDCTLCYLSENSEAVRDLPLAEVHRRIDSIHRHYGPGTDVQITGGEPTLRKRPELLEIVRHVVAKGMRATLMTNGIHATRPLLEALSAAGLCDVAFHVDTTQEIKGYASEVELNALREKYIDRTRGLPVSVFFNTTVHRGNFHEIRPLAQFFVRHAGAVRTASFQLQADTGRGVAGKRDASISLETVTREIASGAGTPINFDTSVVGHPGCNRYGKCVIANGRAYDLFDDQRFIRRMQAATAHLRWNRRSPTEIAIRFSAWLAGNPPHWGAVLRWAARKLWRMKWDLVVGRARLSTLSFVAHNFMDAQCLERDRIDGCVFKTMTRDGPISMCLHNAKRDAFILQPVRPAPDSVQVYWQPLTGLLSNRSTAVPADPTAHPLKRLRGRTRRSVMTTRRHATHR